MIFSEKIDKLLPKLAKLKEELQAVTKGANNPFFKSKYADLNTYLDEVEPRLKAQGMVLFQPVVVDDHGNNSVVSTIIDVESGQFFKSSMKLVGDVDMQKAGGGVTYARRYTLGAMLSMQAEDDDGNVASGKTTNKSASKTSSGSTKSSATKSSSKDSGFRKSKAQTKPQSTGGDDW